MKRGPPCLRSLDGDQGLHQPRHNQFCEYGEALGLQQIPLGSPLAFNDLPRSIQALFAPALENVNQARVGWGRGSGTLHPRALTDSGVFHIRHPGTHGGTVPTSRMRRLRPGSRQGPARVPHERDRVGTGRSTRRSPNSCL